MQRVNVNWIICHIAVERIVIMATIEAVLIPFQVLFSLLVPVYLPPDRG